MAPDFPNVPLWGTFVHRCTRKASDSLSHLTAASVSGFRIGFQIHGSFVPCKAPQP
jgi:hypothetical protein